MRKKTAWMIVLGFIAFLYTASSIPGLRVLPVLRHLFRLTGRMDVTYSRLAQWLAARIPLNFGELTHIDTVMQDFILYVRANPVVIEFFLRKAAHMTVFFFLTLALFFLLYQYVSSAPLAILLSFGGGFALAMLDEFRQSFVAGRVASSVDVFIDMIGVSLAVVMIIFSLILTSGRQQHLWNKKQQQQARKPLRKNTAFAGRYRKIPKSDTNENHAVLTGVKTVNE
jgi:VanZ family protein